MPQGMACGVFDNVVSLVTTLAVDGAALPDELGVFLAPDDAPLPAFGTFALAMRRAAKTSLPVVTAQVVLLERLLKKVKAAQVPRRAVHRLWLASLMVAEKATQDDVFPNEDFAVLCGMPVAHVNAMERAFLTAVEWDLYVSEDEYARVADALQSMTKAPLKSPSRPPSAPPPSSPHLMGRPPRPPRREPPRTAPAPRRVGLAMDL
eukprot:TRINITY_DN4588_c0_g3_i1.p1 TRINITY_DN4588_c0_g3~~TRINITY_DN4588_c0_g3_i1.p1  ORF type:complete len:220 (+),score=86.54 TRINITY_DN4588_c0_g3_i1:44-661(+)